ncbi:MAG: integrase [Paraglaciecola chathamensis]
MSETDILLFTPKHETEFEKNIEDFISEVEAAPNPNEKMDYSSYYWVGLGNFTKIGVNSRKKDEFTWLDDSIIRFAKAYIKYQAIKSGASMYAHFYAIRALEAAITKRSEQVVISKLLPRDFDQAAQEAKANMKEGAAYQAGMKLNSMRNFLIDHKMIKPFEWKNPFSKPKDKKDLTGDVGQEYRESKMPDENSIMAMAAIFAKKDSELTPRDIFTTSTFSLMMSAPERGSEPLYLRSDCLDVHITNKPQNDTERDSDKSLKQGDGTELLLAEDDGEQSVQEQIGIRWFSGKGYGYENKWVPDVMNPVIKAAIKRLKKQSKQAREFAKMLEESDDFPRHPLCPRVDEDKLLTKAQAVAALGLDTSLLTQKQARISGNQLLTKVGIERADYVVSLRDLNKIVRARLPEGWPYIPFKKGKVKLKWSDALYAGFANQFSASKGTIFTDLWIPSITTLNEDLKPSIKKNRSKDKIADGNLSVFARHGYEGLELRSHQPRHLLDTLASVNGMSDTLRSKWAGRADPKHNRYYDHTDEQEYNHDWLEHESKDELVNNDVRNLFKVQIAKGNMRSLQEHNTRASLAVHITEYGECKHSYIDEPCMKHRDCLNCNELVCTKGNDDRLKRIQEKLKKERLLLRGDEKAVNDGVKGAEQWYQRRLTTIKRCESLIAWLTSDDVKDGDMIKLADTENVTHLDRALEANGRKRLPKIENHLRKSKIIDDKAPVEFVSINQLLAPTGIVVPNDDDDDLDYNDFVLEDF